MNEKSISIVSDGLAGISAAVVSVFGGNTPGVVFFAAALPPFLSVGYNAILTDICGKGLSKRECERLGVSYKYAVEHIDSNQKEGLVLRNDSFTHDTEKVKNIIEGVFKRLLDDTEQQKAKFYGYFIANLAFSPEIDYSHANYLQKTISELSYRQLCLIRYYKDNTSLDVSKWENYFERGAIEGVDLYSEILELKRLNLIKKLPPFSVGANLQNTALNQSGEILYRMMNLKDVEEEDMDTLSQLIQKINQPEQNIETI